MKFEKCSSDMANGTSYVTVLHQPYDKMVKMFGPPHEKYEYGDKVRVEWVFRYEDGMVFTIYDWKQDGPIEHVEHWHIGGKYENGYHLTRRIEDYVDGYQEHNKRSSCNNCGSCSCGNVGDVQASVSRSTDNDSLMDPPDRSIMTVSSGGIMKTNQRLAQLDQFASTLDYEDMHLVLLMAYCRIAQECMVDFYREEPQDAQEAVEGVSQDMVIDMLMDQFGGEKTEYEKLFAKYNLSAKYKINTGKPVLSSVIEPSFGE